MIHNDDGDDGDDDDGGGVFACARVCHFQCVSPDRTITAGITLV